MCTCVQKISCVSTPDTTSTYSLLTYSPAEYPRCHPLLSRSPSPPAKKPAYPWRWDKPALLRLWPSQTPASVVQLLQLFPNRLISRKSANHVFDHKALHVSFDVPTNFKIRPARFFNSFESRAFSRTFELRAFVTAPCFWSGQVMWKKKEFDPRPAFLEHLWATDPWYALIKVAGPSRGNCNKYLKLGLNHRSCNRDVCKAYWPFPNVREKPINPFNRIHVPLISPSRTPGIEPMFYTGDSQPGVNVLLLVRLPIWRGTFKISNRREKYIYISWCIYYLFTNICA